MKKVFAVFAAAAVAVSMLAFTGCGESVAENNPDNSVHIPDTGREDEKNPGVSSPPFEESFTPDTAEPPVVDGVIQGNYREVNAMQLAAVLGRINVNKLKEVSGLAFETGISGSALIGDTVSVDTSFVLDYKIGLSADGIAGAGTASIKADYSHSDYPDKAVSVDLNGSLYNDLGFVYASAAGNIAGTVLTGDERVKVNLQEILEAFKDSDVPSTPSWGFDIGSFVNIANLIANTSAFGVKVYVDTDDGIKFKLSATEQTVWAAIISANGDKLTEPKLETLKDGVLINSFKYDIYFAIDERGVFSRASVVSDIDVTVDFGAAGDKITEDGEILPAFTVNFKGFSTVYAFDGEVILPDTVTDGIYVDITETVLNFLEKHK